MKKILSLLLAALCLLPALPVFAADKAAVYIDNFVNIDDEMMVVINSSDESFLGAEITVGNLVYYTLEESGKGGHTAYVDISSLERGGVYEVKVISSFGGEEEVYTQNVTIAKMNVTKTDIVYGTSVSADKLYHVFSQDGGFSKTNWEKMSEDGSQMRLVFPKSLNEMGLGITDIRIGNDGITTLKSDALFVYEGEVMFQNDPDDTETKEKPNGDLEFYFRQSGKYQPQGKPIRSNHQSYSPEGAVSGRVAVDEALRNTLFFNKDGKLPDGKPYYTNTWYKIRFVFDGATYREDGLLKGGARYYLAEMVDGEYTPYRLVCEASNFTMYEITSWRMVPYLTGKDTKGFTINFKNFSYSNCAPEKSWYLDDATPEDGKIKLDFSEDLGDLTKDDFKILNKVGEGEEILISAVEKGEGGTYTLIAEKSLFHGQKYDVLIKNDITSPDGASAFAQPQDDENGDGFWKIITLSAKNYDLNIEAVSINPESATITFTNNNTEGKCISLSWFDENGVMVDFALVAIDQANTSPLTVNRTNQKPATEVFAYVIDLKENGAVKVYDIN